MMKNILFDAKLARDVTKTTNIKAKLKKKELKIVRRFYNSITKETIEKIFDTIENRGHPPSQKACQELRQIYNEGEFTFDDIVKFGNLLDANINNFSEGEEYD